MTRPDLDAILARIGVAHREHPPCASEDVTTLLAYIDELERDLCRMHSDIVEISEAADKDDIPRTIARAALRDWRARMEEIDAT